MTESAYARFGSGRSVLRVEDDKLLKGEGSFTDDVSVSGQTYLAFLRSPHPHARIARIDVNAAAAMPGVVAVVSGEELARAGVKPLAPSTDFKRADGSPSESPPRRALAFATVRFVGEAVAAVLAETRALARDAAEAIEIDYEPLPAVVDPARALEPAAPQVWPAASGNISSEIRHGDAKATAGAFASASHTVTHALVNQRVPPWPLEP